MAVKILITRKVPKDLEQIVKPFLLELHSLAWQSKGYISGETLFNKDNSDERVVISSWQSYESWQNYIEMEETQQLRYKVDEILGQQSEYKVYFN